METLKQSALALAEEVENLSKEVQAKSKYGRDISAHSTFGISIVKRMLPQTRDEKEVHEIISDLRLTISKLRLALFAPELSNLQLNQIVNGQFIDYNT